VTIMHVVQLKSVQCWFSSVVKIINYWISSFKISSAKEKWCHRPAQFSSHTVSSVQSDQ